MIARIEAEAIDRFVRGEETIRPLTHKLFATTLSTARCARVTNPSKSRNSSRRHLSWCPGRQPKRRVPSHRRPPFGLHRAGGVLERLDLTSTKTCSPRSPPPSRKQAVVNESILAGMACVVLIGAAAQWLGWRLKLPSILLLLLGGFFSGPDFFGLVDPDKMLGEMLLPFVALSIAILLFEGGLTLHLDELGRSGADRRRNS